MPLYSNMVMLMLLEPTCNTAYRNAFGNAIMPPYEIHATLFLMFS